MFMRRWIAVVLLPLLAIPACQHDAGGGAITISEFRVKALDQACDHEVRCGSCPDRNACQAFLDTASLDRLVADVESGKIVYDGSAATACLASVVPKSCDWTDLIWLNPESCRATFKGTLLDGAPCYSNQTCKSGSCGSITCPADTRCCKGTCNDTSPQIAVGSDCSGSNAGCIDGAYCSTTGTTSICTPKAATGQACDAKNGYWNGCASGTVCLQSGLEKGTCGKLPSEGQTCNLYNPPCDSSLDYCDSAASKCLRKIPVGGACPSGTGCVDYATCDSNTLRCIEMGQAGESCDPNQAQECMGNLACLNGRCTSPGTADCP